MHCAGAGRKKPLSSAFAGLQGRVTQRRGCVFFRSGASTQANEPVPGVAGRGEPVQGLPARHAPAQKVPAEDWV